MKNRFVQAFILVCFFSSLLYVAPAMGLEDEYYRNIKNKATTETVIETEEITEISTEEQVASIEQNEEIIVGSAEEETETEEVDVITEKIMDAQKKIDEINAPNSLEWFQKYKEIQNEYSEWIDTDETIYDVFSDEELNLLFHIVETEVRTSTNPSDNFDEQVNVCSVIFNRLNDQNYFSDVNTLTGVITQKVRGKSQFSSYGSGAYRNITPTETTKLACEFAYQIGDTTGGALWFDSTGGSSWASTHRPHSFTDNVGHSFYN